MKKCSICGHIKLLNEDLSLFQTPTNKIKLDEWSTAAGVLLEPNSFVCMKHFDGKYIKEIYSLYGKVIRRGLTQNALPALNLGTMSGCGSTPSFNVPFVPLALPSASRKYVNMKKTESSIVPTKRYEDPFEPTVTPSNSKLNENSSDPTSENSISNPNIPVKSSLLPQTEFYDYVRNNLHELNTSLPFDWGVHKSMNSLTVSHIKGEVPTIDKAIVIQKTDVNVFINGICRSTDYELTTLSDITDLIKTIDHIKICSGTGISGKISRRCDGQNTGKKTLRCRACDALRRILLKKAEKFNKTTVTLNKKKKQIRNKFLYLRKRQEHQRKVIMNLQKEMANVNNIEKIVSKLPENQQLVVKTCFETAGKSLTGKRYNKEWIYTCILIKIKSPKLYRHLRTRNLLPLPAPSTLSRYIRNIDSSYGFQNKLFDLVKEKTKNMPEFERHGTLMVDECKVTPSKHFDKNRLEVLGFVDLGKYTPNHQKDKLGDHVLVIMFQSLAGKHMQAIACFLSKGNVLGSIQAKLILEAVLLCEAAGLFIDVVTSDGATWNRAMWKAFGAGDPKQPWCIHPCNEKRKFRMCSDFLHILKCIRNRLVEKKELHIPEGRVQLAHFENLINYDAKNEFKLAPKLTRKHVNPQNHEKMTTRYAFQLFSNTVADALTILKDKNVPGFHDCEPTIQFCKRINELSDILNSNNPFNALRPNSAQEKALEDFLIYMDLWESCAEPQYFLTKSTSEGLRATINTTLDLLKYCTNELKFKYLMTSRINQDPLEHFFGLLRASGGANSNAESLQIAQIFRLISLYSLIKPPRGSNVTGGNMLNALIRNPHDVFGCDSHQNQTNVTKKEIDLRLDQLLDEDIAHAATIKFKDNDEAFAYVCGAIARRHKSEKCSCCVKTLIGTGVETFNTFIILRSRGHLTFPSVTLVTLLQEIEGSISDTLQLEVKRNTLLQILEKISETKIHNFVGCQEHWKQFTKKIIFSFLITRMSFSCQKEARKRSSENTNSKKFAKLAKLV